MLEKVKKATLRWWQWRCKKGVMDLRYNLEVEIIRH